MSAFSALGDSEEFILMVAIGAFEGSFIGAMANVMPFQVVMGLAMMVSLLVWRSQKSSFYIAVIMAAAVTGGGFGAIGGIIPWGFSIFFAIQLVVYLWRTGSSAGAGSLPSLIAVPFYIFISVALFYNNAYADFCFIYPGVGAHVDVCQNTSAWVNGFPTIWAGCVNTCNITPLSFLGSSVFSNFIQAATTGDYIGLISGLFAPSAQTVITGLTLIFGTLLLLVGLGIGFSANVLASGLGITVNEAGTRAAQSFGITLIMWSIFFGGFGGWFTAFGTGLNWGGVLSTSLIVFLATMVFYGAYVQGRTISGAAG